MSLPLDGIRIISMAEQYPGPFATLLMADLGADVIIVERASGGDPSRQFPGFHASLNRNKRSITLDLKSDHGREALRSLIKDADVLMEGFRPGTMARLGFDYAAVAALNPRVVYMSISGFGQTGPYRDRPAHDLSYQAITGMLFRQAATGQPELRPDLAIGDLSSAMFAVVGTLSALLDRTRSGRGKYVDVSMTDCLVSWMTTFLGPVMNGGVCVSIEAEPAYGIFKCADGKLLTLSIAHEDWFWESFCTLLGMTDVARLQRPERLAREPELRDRISTHLLAKPRSHWGELFDKARIPWGPVNSIEEVAADPHFRERGLFHRITERDGTQAWHVAQPLVFGASRPGPTRGVPALGADTAQVLESIGLSPEK
jgi:crotonobetainyl-CoA:carnitine CoA-transferase CaiB-like acyl-CoA transferase